MLLRSRRSTTRLRSVKASFGEPPLPRNTHLQKPTNTVNANEPPAISTKPSKELLVNVIIEDIQDNEDNFWQAALAGTSETSFPRLPHASFQSKPQCLLSGGSCDIDNASISQTEIPGLVCAAWALVLSHHIESQESVFGLKFSTRKTNPNDNIRNILPMRVNADDQETVNTFLKNVNTCTERIKSSKLSLDHVRSLSPDANTACSFQTLIDICIDESELSNSISNGHNDHSEIAQRTPSLNYAVVVECTSNGTELLISARFDDRVVTRTAMRLLLSELEHMVWQLLRLSNVGQTLGNLEAISSVGRRHILRYNRPLPPKLNTFVHHLINAQAANRPDAPAIHAWDGDLTYAQLQNQSDKLAQHLYRLGVRPDMLVPIIFEKSVKSVVALLAVVKAGGGIVPLDPALPLSRLHMIIEDVHASIVITSTKNKEKVPNHIKKCVVVDEELISKLSTLRAGEIIHAPSPSPENALYIIFTSGSTGKPKGVIISHSAFCSSSDCFTKAIFLTTPQSRVLQYSSFTFDACIIEIFSTLTVGSCICIPSDADRMNDVVKCIVDMRVNWAILTPSVATLIDPKDVPLLEVLCLAGEALPQALADTWADHVKAINVYGPTECCILNIISEPRVRGVKSIALGLPRNCAVWIVDEKFEQLVPLNTVGEIVIEGPTLARGYLGDEIKTAAAFTESPKFLEGVVGTSSRFYRTGDLGRMNDDGTIDYFGRKDAQVKIRGQRVELGEIEHHLKKILNSSLDVVVELLKVENGEALVLAAFVSKKAGLRSVTESSRVHADTIIFGEQDSILKNQILELTQGVSDKLVGTLPSYMIPKVFIPCRVLPQTPSGKTDRKKLRALGEALSAEQMVASNPSRAQAVRSSDLKPLERSLRRVWAKILKLPEDSIRPEDDFFKLGGDSIGAIKVVAACRSASLQISVATIFRKSVLRDMAQVCKSYATETKFRRQAFSLLRQADVTELLAEASYECNVKTQMIEDLYPCTHLQEGLMAVNMTRPGAYTARFVHRLSKDTDISKFKKIWEEIHAASPVLRTRFVSTASAGSLQAVIREPIQWLSSTDLEAYLDGDEEAHMMPGTLLSRFAIITEIDKDTVHFVWTIHHMLYDGWSISLICKRFNQMYNGSNVKEAEDFRNFLAHLQELDNRDSATYWQKELEGAPTSTFPIETKPGYQSIARAVIRDHLELQLDPASGLTMSTLVRAAWAIMISYYSGTNDILFGAIVSGRSTPFENIENIEGPTIATVPIRLQLQQNHLVIDFLRHVQNHATSMIQHEQAGIQYIRTLNDDTKRGCDFQNLLVVQFAGDWEESGPLGKPLYREEFTTLPVTCEARLKQSGVEFATHVDEVVTSRAVVAQAISVVKTVLKQLVHISASSTKKLNEISLEDSPDAGSAPCRGPAMPMVIRSCVHDLITNTARQHPDAEAVCSSHTTMSYSVLEMLSSKLAAHLLNMGLIAGSMVPLCFEKSIWAVVAMLGVLKAGAAFVPLNPGQPLTRLRNIVKEVQAQIVLTSPLHAKATTLGASKVVVVDASLLENLSQAIKVQEESRATPDDLAYIIFTSGSTGTPKGVMVSHSAYSSSAVAHARGHMLHPKSRVLQFAAYSFDASLVEILTTLIQGGTVCVPSEKERIEGLSDFMKSMRVDFAVLTPSVARLLRPTDVALLRTLVLAGEAADETLVTKWLEAGTQVVNGYGPSECAVVAANQTLAIGMNSRNIGHAVGCIAWVVDPDDVDSLVPNDETGELLVEGPILAKGYLNDPEKTTRAFIRDPAWSRNSTLATGSRRMYKTGDLVKRSSDGSMIYIGRKDLQVKVNGQRIELGDIESHLAKCKGVERGIVLFPSAGPFKQQLTAVIELDSGIMTLNQQSSSFAEEAAKIREELSTKVPSIMLPKHWMDITSLSSQKFPLSVSGKIDRLRVSHWLEQISRSDSKILDKSTSVNGQCPTIRKSEDPAWSLAKVISSMLSGKTLASENGGLYDIMLHSSGLDSLNMISLMHFISHKYHVKVGMQLLMDKKTTIRSLACFISQSTSKTVSEITVAPIDIMAEINKHDARIAATQLSAPVINGINRLNHTSGPNCYRNGTDRVNRTHYVRGSNDSKGVNGSPIGRLNCVKGSRNNSQTILLTGANGFLGTQILRQLLEKRTIRRVVAIVRGDSPQAAEARTIESARKALWWTDLHSEKLEVWNGDLSMTRLGLDPMHWSLLMDTGVFDAIIHNGAIVHWNKSYAALEDVNVLSTMELLHISVTGFRPRLAYISGGRQWFSENEYDEDVAKELATSIGYSQTKFVSEVVIKRAARRCEPEQCNLAIIKPGLVIGTPHEGIANKDDFLWRLTAACISIGAYNDDDAMSWLHLSDASTTATIAIDAALAPASDANPVHYVGDGMTWGAFWAVLRGVGYELAPKSASQWSAAIQDDLSERKEQHPLWPLSHMLDGMEGDGRQMVLPADIEEVPPLHLRMAVKKNVEFLGNVGFLPLPGSNVHVSGGGEAFTRSRFE